VRVEQGVGLGERELVKPTKEDGRGEGFADPAEGKRAEGYAELDGGEEVVEVLLETADGARAGNASGDHLLNASFADGDEGELGSHKKGVGQDEHGDSDKLQQWEAVHLAVRIAFCGMPAGFELPVFSYQLSAFSFLILAG
jgi:hypothetical protein